MINGVTSSQATSAYAAYASADKSAKQSKEVKEEVKTSDVAAIYEPSSAGVTAKKYTQNTDLVNQLKADTEARMNGLKDMVSKMMSQQATTYGNATDVWSFLRSGNFTVDPETKAKAQADISEDGYWGVKQTSDRIVNFAVALTGGDPSKIDTMVEAFQKGFKMATKTWGGTLPEISQQTYDAVMEKFNALKNPEEA